MRLLRWVAVLALAASALGAEKPILVFSRTADCNCAAFEATIAHPAMQRRLATVTFERVIGDETYIAVKNAAGREAMRWSVIPTWLHLADILTLTDGAMPYLQPPDDERQWALAVLALGDRDRGRELLEDLRKSPSAENRELAAVWLERVDGLEDEAPLAKLAAKGTTRLVRFEAWMAIGDLRVARRAYEDAVDAYDRAAALMPHRNALWAPPFRTRFEARTAESGLLRAVLRLDDGSEAEDALLVNTSTLVMESGAHLVEVPAYFDGAVHPRDVSVREGGQRRAIEQIIRPAEAPLVIGLLVDNSLSMAEHMLDVQEAALRFVETNLGARDKTMVVTFSSAARVRLRPSSDRELVSRTLLRMRPHGGTALNDAIITALLQMQAPGSRKALVVFTDGSSVFSPADAAEVARRAGVPIYVLSLRPEKKDELTVLSERTGGMAFDMTSRGELGELWSRIGADLRRQSLVD